MARLTLILGVLATVVYLLDGFRFMLNEWRNWRARVKRTGTWLGLLALLVCLPSVTEANIITAASCSFADVGTAVTASANGDIVQIPGGTCDWTTNQLTNITKNITIRGVRNLARSIGHSTEAECGTPGSQSTYTCITGEGRMLVHATPTGSTELSDITFIARGGAGTTCQNIVKGGVNPGGLSFRVTRTSHYHYLGCSAIVVPNATGGVLDHNYFDSHNAFQSSLTTTQPTYQGVGLYGDNSWAQPSTIGLAGNVFIEDNEFHTVVAGQVNIAHDHEYGSRAVHRFNTYNDRQIQTHGTESGGRNRGHLHFEAYRNQFNWTGASTGALIVARGGTMISFDNKLTGAATRIGDFNTLRADVPSGYNYFTWAFCKSQAVTLNRSGTSVTAWTPTPHGIDSSTSYINISGAAESTLNGNFVADISGNVTISTSSIGNPTTITTATPHGLTDQSAIALAGHTSSTPDINLSGSAYYIATVTGANTFTIPVNVTNDGVDGLTRDLSTFTYTTAASGSVVGDSGTAQGAFDGNTASTGYPCLDQVGRGQGDYFSGDIPSMTPVAWPNQALVPIKCWHNLDDGVLSACLNSAGGASVATANRDYFNEDASCTGASCTAGVGRGTVFPTGCTPVASGEGPYYWRTDLGTWNTSTTETYSDTPGEDGQLFNCTAANTWTFEYEPYTYPHPLNVDVDQPAPSPVVIAMILRWMSWVGTVSATAWFTALEMRLAFAGMHMSSTMRWSAPPLLSRTKQGGRAVALHALTVFNHYTKSKD